MNTGMRFKFKERKTDASVETPEIDKSQLKCSRTQNLIEDDDIIRKTSVTSS
jgi:hypothetical protein